MRYFNKVIIFLIAVSYSLLSMGQQDDVTRRLQGIIPEQEYMYAFGEATKLYLFGNYAQAVNLYNECLKINPNSSAIQYQLAKVYRLVGEMDLATEHAKIAVAVSPDNKWYLEELANNYQLTQKFDSAIMIYQKLLIKNQDDFGIVFLLASLYERIGKFELALDYLNKIEKRYGVSKETAVNKSRIYESMNNEKLAMEQLQRALVLSDYDYTVLGMMAELFRESKKPDSAFYYYGKIYPEYRTDPLVAFSYAEFLMEQQDRTQAEKVLLEAMQENSMEMMAKARYLVKAIQDEKIFALMKPVLDTITTKFYSAYNFDLRAISIFADVEVRLEKYDKAAQALKRIINVDTRNYAAFEQLIYCVNASESEDSVLKYCQLAIGNLPERPIPYLFGGSAWYQMKLYDQAIEMLERGIQLSSNSNLTLEFYSLLAECYQRVNKFEKSEEYFKAALDIDNNNLGIRNNYAYYLAERNKDLEKAENLSKLTIKVEPHNPTYLDTYGWILFQMGKVRSAKKYIVSAIERGGKKNSEILLHYGDILYKLNKGEEAIEAWNQALQFADQNQKSELEKRIAESNTRIKP